MNNVSRPRLANPQHDLMSALINGANEYGVDVSTSHFAGAKFARDFIWISKLLLPWFPKVATRTVFQLAREIGLEYDASSEMEPGKVPHEVRRDMLDGVAVTPEAQKVISENGPLWGGSEHGFRIGFSADATPLWLMLVYKVNEYSLEHQGGSILETSIDHISGQHIPLRMLVSLAAEWVEREVHTSLCEDGFAQLGWTRKNPSAHPFQILEDGDDYMVDSAGKLANADARLYAISLQGYAYDALRYASLMLADSHSSQATHWASLAKAVQTDTLVHNWIEEKQYFAAGWHHDKATGQLQRIDMLALQPSTLLATEIFRDVPGSDKYVAGIWRMLYSPRFITPAGCRSKSVEYFDLLGYVDYHGPASVWGISQAIAQLGAANYQTPELGLHLGHSHMLYLEALGSWSEGLYVGKNGEVVVHYGSIREAPESRRIVANFTWQEEQMWTVATCLALYLRQSEPNRANTIWNRSDSSKSLVDEIRQEHSLRLSPASSEEVNRVRDKAQLWCIDTKAGRAAAKAYRT